GRAGEVMRRDAYEQLRMLQNSCHFRYIRFHGLYHEEMAIVKRKDDRNLEFNFQYMDMLFDSLLELDIRPIVELGLMPDVMASENKYVFWWKMNISMPKFIEEWRLLVNETVKHLTHRYGEEEIKKWYFEVWNEPNHPAFFANHKEIDKYFELYDNAAYAVKEVNSEYKVGGPATAGLGWVPEMIAHCRENNVPLDFISTHYYCVKGAFDANGKSVLYMQPREYLSDAINKIGEICKKEGYPLLITEWSASYSSRDAVHDSYYSAPFILSTLKECEGYADMMSYWTYTDIFEEVGPAEKPFHGGFGLINMQSLPKPSFYAYEFLGKLGKNRLECDDKDAYVCRSDSEMQILFWNLVHPDQDLPNSEYFSKPCEAKKIDDAKIEISGLESNRKYNISVETIGYKSGDVYNAYLDRNFTELPTREEIKELIERSVPKKTICEIKSNNEGKVTLTVPQSENQVDLVRISL
ncbi:MAG: hypothetical protein E7633_10320, partial [Ruminococcaceae bacterium]|nr:hypothetical protein [Oscillospiraceae bacterium]